MAFREIDPGTPTAEIELDCKRLAALPWRVVKKFKEITGHSLTKGFEMEELSTLMWLALQEQDPELTLDAVDGMMHMRHAKRYADLMESLMDESFGKRKEGEGEDPNPPSPTTSS